MREANGRHRMTERTGGDEVSENDSFQRLVRALRFQNNEVQLGRALHLLCQEPPVARAFLEAVLANRVCLGEEAPRAIDLPDEIECVDEARLFAANSAGLARRRLKELGRVDLSFRGPSGFVLVVELKLGANFRQSQIEDYVAAGQPVVAIVRDAAKALETVDPRLGELWLGATSWESIACLLHQLPLADGNARRLWTTLVDVLEQSGELASNVQRRQASSESVALLEDIRPVISDLLDDEFRRRYRRAPPEAMAWHAPRAGRRWAWLELRAHNETMLEIGAREGETSAPIMHVQWCEPSGRRAKAPREEILEGSENVRWHRSQRGLRTYDFVIPGASVKDRRDIALNRAEECLRFLIECGVFDWDMDTG